jgi:hypothetical protein
MRLLDHPGNTPVYVQKLLEHTESIFGQKIQDSADCGRLADDIFRTTAYHISPQTLRRLFKLISSSSSPSKFTLEVLSKYCGFRSLNHYKQQESESTELQSGKFNEASIYKEFFEVDAAPSSRSNLNDTYRQAIKNIIKRVYHDRDLYNIFTPMVAGNITAQNYLFEEFPYISGLGRGFAAGYNFYLKHKREPEGQCLGNAILFVAAVLQNDYESIHTYIDAINCLSLSDIKHPSLIGRYIGSNLLYHHLTGNLEEQNRWEQLAVTFLSKPQNTSRFQMNSIEYERMISIYFLLSERYERVVEFITPVLTKFLLLPKDVEYSFWIIPMKIMLFKAHIYCGRKKMALAILPEYESADWLFEDYYRIHFLDAKIKITDNKRLKQELVSDLKRMISKTNFPFFEKLITLGKGLVV